MAEIIERHHIAAVARAWIGTPYHHQASLQGVGTDCFGLVRGVWRALYGSEPLLVPAYSSDWAEATRDEAMLSAARCCMAEVPLDAMAAGDVVVFRWRRGRVAKHAGLLINSGTMVHATEGASVCEVSLTPWWRRRLVAAFAFPGVID